MPLIPFPNVPPLPGVPNIRRAVTGALTRTGILPAIRGLDRFGLLDSLMDAIMGPQWGVFDEFGLSPILEPDTIAAVEYKGDEDIANHPVEKGGFASYNKVSKPFEVAVTMTCSGQNMGREAFLSAVDDMKYSLDLYTVITPDAVYNGMNLVHYDYKRTSQSGVSLLTVNCRFQEVRETATTTFTETAKPDGAATQGGGTVTSAPATKGATAAAGSKAVQ